MFVQITCWILTVPWSSPAGEWPMETNRVFSNYIATRPLTSSKHTPVTSTKDMQFESNKSHIIRIQKTLTCEWLQTETYHYRPPACFNQVASIARCYWFLCWEVDSTDHMTERRNSPMWTYTDTNDASSIIHIIIIDACTLQYITPV